MTMTPHAMATTTVNRNRAHNVDSIRLHARRAFLIPAVQDGAGFDRRLDFVVRAHETWVIENVLVTRGDLDPACRVTLP